MNANENGIFNPNGLIDLLKEESDFSNFQD